MAHEKAANTFAMGLLRARDAAELTTRPSAVSATFDLDAGYAVARVLHERLEERGYRSSGRKIGFTNPATWREFGLSTPIWAHVYAQTVHFSDEGRLGLNVSGMAAPRIEPEVVVGLRDPTPANGSPADLATCLEWAAIGFEIVDCHYAEWRFGAAEAVADFGVHAALVVGSRLDLTTRGPEQTVALLENLTVRLSRGEDLVDEGQGRNALGGPVLAVGHLAEVLQTQGWAPPLEKGEVITTGTLTSLPYVSRGERWRVDVDGAPLAMLELEIGE